MNPSFNILPAGLLQFQGICNSLDYIKSQSTEAGHLLFWVICSKGRAPPVILHRDQLFLEVVFKIQSDGVLFSQFRCVICLDKKNLSQKDGFDINPPLFKYQNVTLWPGNNPPCGRAGWDFQTSSPVLGSAASGNDTCGHGNTSVCQNIFYPKFSVCFAIY